MTYAGILSATALLFGTTADDAVWLIPYLSPTHFTTFAAFSHAIAFCLTIQAVVWSIGGICFLALSGVAFSGMSVQAYETHLQVAGVLLAWTVAIILCYKAYMKRLRKLAAAVAKISSAAASVESTQTAVSVLHVQTTAGYGSIDTTSRGMDAHADDFTSDKGHMSIDGGEEFLSGDSMSRTQVNVPQMSTCVWLTLVGCLDEVSYFPSLILTKTYTTWQLSVGAFFACLLILGAITLARHLCAPVLDFFDKIPLYFVTLAFAVYMTLDLVLTSGD